MILLGMIFTSQMIVLLIIFILMEYRRTGEIVTPWTIFLGMSIFDVFAPGFLFLCFTIPDQPYSMESLNKDGLIFAILIFALSILFFALGYFFISEGPGKNRALKYKSVLDDALSNVRFVYILLFVSGLWYILTILAKIKDAGSLWLYISSKLIVRWEPKPTEFDNIFDLIFNRFGSPMFTVFLTVIGILFFYRRKYHREFLWGFVFPFIGWLFTITTFFRGSQIAYFISLLAIETIRVKLDKIETTREKKRDKDRLTIHGNYRKALGLMFLGIALFISYGTVRNFYSAQVKDFVDVSTTDAILFEGERFIRGEGLIGLSSIIAFYPKHGEYFYGKTIVDMSLLLVPRYIWTSKPEWYGIDDITRRMGWPETTGFAVTMPGELYANFGLLGIPLMVVFGGIFGFFYKHRYDQKFRFVYAFVFLPGTLNAFWMSYTGLVNRLIDFPLVFFILFLISRKNYKVRLPIHTNTLKERLHYS